MSLLLLLTNRSDPRHYELLKVAEGLLEEGKYDYAVVAAQTACEVYAEVAVTELLSRRKLGSLEQVIPELLSGYSLMDKRGQKLLEALTGQKVTQADFWTNYRGHVERRNAVVHGGHSATADEARGSLAAARSFFAYVADAWEKSV